MNLKLSGDISAVCNHRIDGDEKMVGNLLVGHSLNQGYDDILLSIAKLLIAHRSLVNHIGNLGADIILLQFSLSISDGRNKDFLLHLGVMSEPFLIIIYIVKGGTELIVVQTIGR